MGCNCGKNRRRPVGSGGVTTTTTTTQNFTLRTLDGKTQTFGSKLEAEAARVRAGGGTLHIF